jgi:hypothetical protein
VKTYTDTLAYRFARYVHIIESNSSTTMRDTNLAESHTTWKDGEWVGMSLVFRPFEENAVPSGLLRPGDIFKAVLDPEWDELCNLPPGESAIVGAEVIDPSTAAKTPSGQPWTTEKAPLRVPEGKRKRKGALADEKPAKKAKKSKKKDKKSDEPQVEEECLPTPPATTRSGRIVRRPKDADFGL